MIAFQIVLRRGLQAILVALFISALCFFLVRSLPGDLAYRVAAGRYGYDHVTSAAADAVRAELRLDRPAVAGLISWWGQLISLDLGRSVVNGRRVTDEIASGLGATVRLSLTALAVSLLVATPLGFLAGWSPGGWVDRTTLVASAILKGVPQFLLGLILMAGMALRLRLVPIAGFDETGSIVLPALTLSLTLGGASLRVARDTMAAVRETSYIAYARIKGLSDLRALIRHGLRNAASPVIAYLAVQFAFLLEGVVVVETLFAWPGIGHALIHALFDRDIPVLQGAVLVMSLALTAMSAGVDLLTTAIDPRRRVT